MVKKFSAAKKGAGKRDMESKNRWRKMDGYGKSGPSGALAEAIVFISIARGDEPRAKCAITGQLTTKGFVLKVSSIAEKTQAAMKGKYTTMVMPAGNKSEFESLPEGGRMGITPKFVSTLKEAVLFCFPVPVR
ncbi:hypothetical protein niasHT_035073 [Heterodera trifolii]|uniref:Lon proteolytic domain-containing protein n=1 Tax=Heterodera trifolii TaxID=157864 RepID=A0ABD2IL69_9BILA